MIISNQRTNQTPRWLLTGALLLAVGLMPLGVAYGQDIEAVGTRLREAVRSGELSREQAGAMMDALRESATPDQAADRSRERIARARAELKKAVEAGRISADDAQARLDEMRKHMAAEGRGDQETRRISREDYARTRDEFQKAVETGRISAADAQARLDEMRQRMAGQSDARPDRDSDRDRDRDRDAINRRIAGALTEAGVERDKIRDVIGSMRKMTGAMKAEGDRWEMSPRMKEHLTELGLNRKQIKLVQNLSRRMVSAKTDVAPRRAKKRIELGSLQERIQDAVEAGKITRKEATQLMEGIRKRLREIDAYPSRTDRDRNPRARIEAAVEAGKITREEADAKYRAIREKNAAKKAAKKARSDRDK